MAKRTIDVVAFRKFVEGVRKLRIKSVAEQGSDRLASALAIICRNGRKNARAFRALASGPFADEPVMQRLGTIGAQLETLELELQDFAMHCKKALIAYHKLEMRLAHLDRVGAL